MISNHADSIQQALNAHRAMAILQLLDGPLRGGANDRLLIEIFERIKLRTSRTEMRSLLNFLDREGAISTSTKEGLIVVELKYHGHELAAGLMVSDGIEKPKPESPYLG